jgi:hypothetical protein
MCRSGRWRGAKVQEREVELCRAAPTDILTTPWRSFLPAPRHDTPVDHGTIPHAREGSGSVGRAALRMKTDGHGGPCTWARTRAGIIDDTQGSDDAKDVRCRGSCDRLPCPCLRPGPRGRTRAPQCAGTLPDPLQHGWLRHTVLASRSHGAVSVTRSRDACWLSRRPSACTSLSTGTPSSPPEQQLLVLSLSGADADRAPGRKVRFSSSVTYF